MYKQPKKRKILCVFAHGKLKNARLPHAAKSEMQDLTRPSTHAQPENILSETNISPKDGWLEDDPFILGWPIFRGELLNFQGRYPPLKKVETSRNHQCFLGGGAS